MFARPSLHSRTADNLFGVKPQNRALLGGFGAIVHEHRREREVSQLNYDWSMVARA